MKLQRHLIAVALVLGLPACVTEYSEVEAPKHLTLDNASGRLDVRFAPGSSRLLAGDAARLHAAAAGGRIAPSDRVSVSIGGDPVLVRARFASVANELLHHRIVATELRLAGVPANRAIVQTGRYLVTTPPCPNWSKNPPMDYTNTPASNFGCATAVNFGRLVASPADLVEGRPLGLADAIPAAAAVQRYQSDKIQLPGGAGLGPIASVATAPTGSGATGAGTAGSAP